MRSTMRAISRCSTRTRPDPYPDWIIKSTPPRALLETHFLQGGIGVASLDVGHDTELDMRHALERYLILLHLVHGAGLKVYCCRTTSYGQNTHAASGLDHGAGHPSSRCPK